MHAQVKRRCPTCLFIFDNPFGALCAIFYFTTQLKDLYKKSGLKGLQEIYKRLTKRFLLNEYVINDEFDVFVAFETMNNRGKKLSDLELLKNRLIYLTMLYDGNELDPAERKNLRDSVNDAWKEVYHQLGRNKTLRIDDFRNLLEKKFDNGNHGGYYEWYGLRFFLYEYELSLLSEAIQVKVDWNDLLKTPKDKISIEHIYPQTQTEEWEKAFEHVDTKHRRRYVATLGNLLLLSASINSSLQNHSFDSKKKAHHNDAGQKIRNGYADGSHSEIEVSQETIWGPQQIHDRGIRLLSFMEKRWDFKFGDADKEKLLFLKFGNGP